MVTFRVMSLKTPLLRWFWLLLFLAQPSCWQMAGCPAGALLKTILRPELALKRWIRNLIAACLGRGAGNFKMKLAVWSLWLYDLMPLKVINNWEELQWNKLRK